MNSFLQVLEFVGLAVLALLFLRLLRNSLSKER